MTTPFTFRTWTAALSARGWTVLSPSHAVPVQLWLRSGDTVLHLLARGTRVVLRRYAASDLTVAAAAVGLRLRRAPDGRRERPHRAGPGHAAPRRGGPGRAYDVRLDVVRGGAARRTDARRAIFESLLARMTGIEGRSPGRTPTPRCTFNERPGPRSRPGGDRSSRRRCTQPLQLPG